MKSLTHEEWFELRIDLTQMVKDMLWYEKIFCFAAWDYGAILIALLKQHGYEIKKLSILDDR